VLSRLRASRRGLIGPTVFPVFMLALKAGLVITLAFTMVAAALGLTTADRLERGVVEIVIAFARRALLLFACTTLAFAAIDFWQWRWLLRTNWDPRRLPPVVRLENRISRLNSLIEMVLLAVGLLWLLLVTAFPWLLFAGAAPIVEPAPIWRSVYVPIVGLTAGAVALSAINFIRPFWTPARSVARIALHIGSLVIFLVLLRADAWITARAGAALPNGEPLQRLVDVINMGCRIGFIVASIVSVVGCFREILNIRSRRRVAANTPGSGTNLLERYLQAVQFFLPRRQQDDVAGEITAGLRVQMDDLEKAIGRTLTDDERANVVRRYGHPVVVAARYREREHLISPSLFPLYIRVLGVALAVMLLATLTMALFSHASTTDPRSSVMQVLDLLLGRGLTVFACATLGFAVVDRWQLRRQADARASREREEAQAIQRALLPASLPTIAGCELAVRWQPASAFGGDCYDAIRVSDTAIAISIADVCGKGLPAALVMSNLQASVRAFAMSDPSPRFVVSHLNRALCRNGDLRRFVTFFYGIYDSSTRRLIYCNAGHNPPAVIRSDGSIVRLSAGGMVVGMFDEVTYEQGEVGLEPGDRLILFTDGITEAESSDGLEFGDDRLLETIARSGTSNPEGVLRNLFDEVASFAGRHLRDDATAIAVAIRQA
jgi:stage II sporulation SpoE-like protein